MEKDMKRADVHRLLFAALASTDGEGAASRKGDSLLFGFRKITTPDRQVGNATVQSPVDISHSTSFSSAPVGTVLTQPTRMLTMHTDRHTNH